MRPTPLRCCSDVQSSTLMRLNHRRSRKTYCLVPKRNRLILLTNLNVLDDAKTLSQRLNWYVNKTDLLDTFLLRFTGTQIKTTNFRRRTNWYLSEADQLNTSQRRFKWYLNETDIFQMS